MQKREQIDQEQWTTDVAEAIAARTETLGTETGKLFEAARTAAAPGGGAQAFGGRDDDVVDAKLEDVSDDRKSG